MLWEMTAHTIPPTLMLCLRLGCLDITRAGMVPILEDDMGDDGSSVEDQDADAITAASTEAPEESLVEMGKGATTVSADPSKRRDSKKRSSSVAPMTMESTSAQGTCCCPWVGRPSAVRWLPPPRRYSGSSSWFSL